MSFPRKYLHETEEIILDLKPHLWYMVQPVAALVVSVGLWTWLSGFVKLDGSVNTIVNWGGIALIAISFLGLAWSFITWRTTHFVVTTDRLIFRVGVFAKRGKEIPLERINDIAASQTFFERLIGSGDLLIESGGEQGQQRFTDIRRPFDLQNDIYREMERTKGRDMDRMSGRRELSIPEQIEKLDALREKGVLTQAEFDIKKQQLLDRL